MIKTRLSDGIRKENHEGGRKYWNERQQETSKSKIKAGKQEGRELDTETSRN